VDLFDGKRVRARLLTGGFHQAYGRFQVAERDGDAQAAFYALFEGLNWVHAADDAIARTWRPRGAVEEEPWYGWRADPSLGRDPSLVLALDGLRYARNRVHHQWADAIVTERGLTFPLRFDATLSNWVWRPVDDLPTPSNAGREAHRRRAYVAALEGRNVGDALAQIAPVLGFIGVLLDPPSARRGPPPVVSMDALDATS
jgi:hypothetical protein